MLKLRREKKNFNMLEGPLLSPIISFAIPLMASSLLQLFFNAADTVVVGRFAGSEALAAVGSTGSITMLITNLFIGLSVGSNVVCARFLGSQEHEEVHDTVHTSILVSLISGIFITFLGLVLSRPAMVLMDSPDNVIDLAVLYMRIIFIGMPGMMLYNFGSAILRAKGDTKRPLYILTSAGILNVGLNLIFVIVFHMSVAGVALATIISQYISSILVVILLIKENSSIHLNLKELRVNGRILKEIARIGIPSGLQGMMFSISNIFIQKRINGFGSDVIAGNSAAGNLEGFAYMGINAFSQAAVTFTSQNYGARNYQRIKKIFWTAMMLGSIMGVLAGGIGALFGRQLLGIYSQESKVLDAGMIRIAIITIPYITCVPMDVVTSSLRGMGYSLQPMLMTVFGVCVLRLIWIIGFFPMFPYLEAIYISYPVSWVVTGVAEWIFLARVKRKFPKDGEVMVR